jgi:Zn-dependent peptidase ImmA (M78 family)
MKIPRRWLVGDNVWTVKFVRKFKWDGVKDSDLMGLCDPERQEILIKVGIDQKDRIETLVHELLHAIEFEYDIKIGHKLIKKLEGPITKLIIENFIG